MTSVTKEYVDEQCLVGSGNAAWVPMALDGGNPEDAFHVVEQVRNNGGVNFYLQYVLPLPTIRNGKDLKLDRVKVLLWSADDDNYLSMIKVLGMKYNGITTYYNSNADYKDPGAIDINLSPDKDASGSDQVIVTLHCIVAEANKIKIAGVLLKVYYD